MKLLFHQRASVRVRGAEESGLGTGPRNPKTGNFSSLGLNHVQWMFTLDQGVSGAGKRMTDNSKCLRIGPNKRAGSH